MNRLSPGDEVLVKGIVEDSDFNASAAVLIGSGRSAEQMQVMLKDIVISDPHQALKDAVVAAAFTWRDGLDYLHHKLPKAVDDLRAALKPRDELAELRKACEAHIRSGKNLSTASAVDACIVKLEAARKP